ncbi:MAG: hypothetical protein CHACPFDD_03310 [Phycisphaerae bacterium]|nr:hypothetical protein [Phycisphaerae bacterium]
MVTVGMNYDVLAGKEAAFETMFDAVLTLMKGLPGHEETQLFRAVVSPQSYLIVSRWSDRAAFDAFVKSPQFQKVTDWGKSQVLAGRPKHEVYGEEHGPQGGRCPVAH